MGSQPEELGNEGRFCPRLPSHTPPDVTNCVWGHQRVHVSLLDLA